MSTILHTKLYCRYTGLVIGELDLPTVAGALPYMTAWNKMVLYHPIFGMSTPRLLAFAKDEWRRLNKHILNDDITEDEATNLRVAFLAVLHSLECIKQDQPVLPSLAVVQMALLKALSLANWKWFLESKKVQFPTYHICKENNNLDCRGVQDFIDACIEIKNKYERTVSAAVEREKINATNAALKALRSEWVTPPSKKVLWKWVKTQLPAKYDADVQGWLGTLFLGGSSAIVDFDKADIDLFEEILVAECEIGSSLHKAVRDRITAVKQAWSRHNETFTIDLADYAVNRSVKINGHEILQPDPGAMPIAANFNGKRAAFLQATAKWQIAKAAYDSQQAKIAAQAKLQSASAQVAAATHEV